MAKATGELTLNIPWDIIDSGSGIALDIGGSVFKVLYLHKSDWVEPKNRIKGSKGRLHAASFAREQVKQALEQIKPNVHILRASSDDVPHIYVTGFGGAQFNDSIKDTFQVNTNILTEFDCFIHSFLYMLKTMPRKQILHELHRPAFERAKRIFESLTGAMAKMKNTTDLQMEEKDSSSFSQQTDELTDKIIAEETDVFPVMLVMQGSAIGCIVVNEDGTFYVADGSPRGGRMFLGLGALLTGATTYDDLLALCEKGNSHKVSATNTALLQDLKSDDSNVYQIFEDVEEDTTFCFGQAVGKQIGDFQKEDLASCLLETMVIDLVQVAQNAAWRSKVKHVFFCGSFTNHPLVRASLMTLWLKKYIECTVFMKVEEKCEVHFLKHGAYMGALGAFLNSKLRFGGNNTTQQEPTAPQKATEQQKGKEDRAGYTKMTGL